MLLLEQPLVDSLLNQSLGGRGLGAALGGLRLLLGASYTPTWPPITPL